MLFKFLLPAMVVAAEQAPWQIHLSGLASTPPHETAQPGSSQNDPSAITARRILAQTKAKFKKSHKKLYLFDDWMQTYVVPRAQY